MSESNIRHHLDGRRYWVVLGGIICQFCVGMLYSWSIFQNSIAELFGLTKGQVSVTFSISTFMLPLAMIVGGQALPKQGPKKVALAGGILLSIGLFLASYANNIYMIYIGYGFLGGAGVGLVYGVPIGTCVKWFPERKGMITGLAVAGFGLGSCIYAPIASVGVSTIGPLLTLRYQGVVSLVGIFIGAFLLEAAPLGYCPQGYIDVEKSIAPKKSYHPKEMVHTWQFWFLLFMYLFANATGLLLVGHASPMGQQVAGLTIAQGALVVSFLTICNTFGRFFGGAASDKFDCFTVLIFLFVLSACCMLTMPCMKIFPLFALNAGMIAFSFGGTVGAFPSIILDYYGAKHYSVNYGFVFLAFGCGGLLGSQIASQVLRLQRGIYTYAFIIAGSLCIIGGVMAFFAKKHPLKE